MRSEFDVEGQPEDVVIVGALVLVLIYVLKEDGQRLCAGETHTGIVSCPVE